MASKDDSYGINMKGIDFADMNQKAGRQSVAIGRSNKNSLSVPLQYGLKGVTDAEKNEKKK